MITRHLRKLPILIAFTVLASSQGVASGKSAIGSDASSSFPTSMDAPQSPAALGDWALTGPLQIGREGHTATLLPDGRVLAIGAGGNATASPAEASIEAYDPVAGTWQALISMRPPRRGHTATLLPDGRVLIAGGDGGPGQPLATESLLFDPATGALTATGGLTTPRAQHSATLLPDGRVLVLGGGNPGFLASVEIFDPISGTWATIGQIQKAREYHTATLLPDGKIMVIGGAGAGGRLTSIEHFDLATGISTEAAQLTSPRAFHTATLLPDGHVLIAGGDNGSGDGFPAKAEIFDPATGSVSETAAMQRPRRYHTATLLPDGRVLVAGGDRNSPLAETELFDPNGPIIEWVNGPSLNVARRFHSATLLPDGSVLAAGGYGAEGVLASAERLTPKPCDFFEDVTVAQALPDPTFAQLLALGGYLPANRKDLGVTTINRYVAHSFVGLAKPGMRIADATLTILAEPGGGGSSNDAFHALVARPTWASSPRISMAFGGAISSIPGLNLNSGWTAAGAKTVVTPLTGNVLGALNTDGRLDVLVQDDTTVSRMFLRLHYVCCDVWKTLSASSSQIGPELDAYLTAQSFPAPSRKGFGDPSIDRAVGHSFTLPSLPGAIITAAKLTVNAQPGADGEVVFAQPQNDAIHALVAPAPPIQSWMIQPDLLPSWTSGGGAMALLMTITDPALLKKMNDTKRLDIFVQDDSTVFSMRLELFYACCGDWRTLRRDGAASPHPDLVTALNAVGFQNGIKGFGDSTINAAFAHSFAGLSVPGMYISGIQLIVRGPGVGGSNDTASVLVAPVAGSQTNWPLTGNWDNPNSQSLPLTLLHNGGNNSLFSALNSLGRLDVYVQDDTQVDGLILRLRYDCGLFRELLGPGPDQPPWTLVERPDLWMEDTPHTFASGFDVDSGVEPDSLMIGQPMWQSRAIWVRNEAYDAGNPTAACANTQAQNPIFAGVGFENTVCVKIANRGQATGAGTLRLYWAQAALGLGWDALAGWQPGTTNGDWTETSTSVAIPPLAAGADTVIALPWAPPEPPFQQELHTCLLARIEALAPDQIWTETADVNHNTTMNNNIAWRNVQVVRDIIVGDPGRIIHPVVLRNLHDARREYAVQLRPVTEDGKENFLDQGQVTLRLPQALYDTWKAAGAPGRGFRHIPGEAAVIVDTPEGAFLSGLPLGPREAVELQLSFAKRHIPFRGGASTNADEIFDIEMTQMVEEDGLLYEEGGVAYALRLPNDFPDATPTSSPTPSQGSTPTPSQGSTPTPFPTPSPSSSPTLPPSPVASPTPAPGTLSNISTRAFVGTGDDVMIGGFIVRGAPVKVILRAIGPSLAASNVPGPLLDPNLRLFSGQTVIDQNDNWETGNCKAEAPEGLWPKDRREACLVITLEPGPYTAIVNGVGATTGIALVEAFHSGGAGELSNISTRAKVRVGDEVMIGGFIVRGQPVKAILRGLGHSLSASGVPGSLQNPRLRLFSGQTVIAQNDDWEAGNCKAESPQGLWPKDPKEACLVITLPPGPYTAIVDGVGATSGVSLVEIFNAGQ